LLLRVRYWEQYSLLQAQEECDRAHGI
jgi:hypothetical protein